jgi:transposase
MYGLNLLMRREQTAGAVMFAYYGRLPNLCYVVNASTGEVSPALLFVAVLGASSYVYAEACLVEGIAQWIDCHIRAFHYFGGTTGEVVPCLSGVGMDLPAHHRYRYMARCFSTKITTSSTTLPPEVQVVVRWIATILRKQTFTSLPQLNACIFGLVQRLNMRPFKKLLGSRQDWFDLFERPALNFLPPLPFDQEIWLRKQIPNDCHIEIDGHYYSVPHQTVGQCADVLVTPTRVAVFTKGQRITSHARAKNARGKSTTKSSHERSTRKIAPGWSPERVLRWAKLIGPATAYMISTILAHSQHSQEGVCACLGLLSLEKEYGRERLESACRHAATHKSWTVTSIHRVLKANLDRQFVQLSIPLHIPPS